MTTPSEILSRPYARRVVKDESGSYTASILEFPGCFAFGETAGEALDRLEQAAESWVTVAIANGNQIREPFDSDGYSGKVALRLPRTLHRQVAEFAELEHTSINQLLVHAISNYVGGRDAFRELANKLVPHSAGRPMHVNVAVFAKLPEVHITKRLPTDQILIAPPNSTIAPLLQVKTALEVTHG